MNKNVFNIGDWKMNPLKWKPMKQIIVGAIVIVAIVAFLSQYGV